MSLYFNVFFLKLAPIAGGAAAVANAQCNEGTSDAFPATLTPGNNAFCGAGAAHTPVTYTTTPANDEDRIREIVRTHCAGSCTQRVSLIIRYSLNKPAISAVNSMSNYIV